MLLEGRGDKMACMNPASILGILHTFTKAVHDAIQDKREEKISAGNIVAYVFLDQDYKDDLITKLVTIDPEAKIVADEKTTPQERETLYHDIAMQMRNPLAKVFDYHYHTGKWKPMEKVEKMSVQGVEELLADRVENILIKTPQEGIYYYNGGLDPFIMRGHKPVFIRVYGSLGENPFDVRAFSLDVMQLFMANPPPDNTKEARARLVQELGSDVGNIVSSYATL